MKPEQYLYIRYNYIYYQCFILSIYSESRVNKVTLWPNESLHSIPLGISIAPLAFSDQNKKNSFTLEAVLSNLKSICTQFPNLIHETQFGHFIN